MNYRKIVKYLIRDKVKTYNISDIVKYLTKYPRWLYLPYNIHHGWYTAILPRQKDLKKKTYPLMLVWNKRQKENWKKSSKISVESIGAPFIHYRRKKKISPSINATGTLALPAHSSKNTSAKYDIDLYCKMLKNLPDKYHPITICLHYYDYNTDLKKNYHNKGFKVVTAGHVHSSNFVDKFYDILKNNKYCTSNSIGTFVLYSVELGIPFFLFGPEAKILRKKGHYKVGEESVKQQAANLFNYPKSEINEGIRIKENQREFVLKESGVEDCVDLKKLKYIMLYNFFFKIIPLIMYRIVKLPVLGIKKALRI